MVFEKVKLNWVKVDPSNPETKFGSDSEFQWSVDVLVDGDKAMEWVDGGFANKRRPVKDQEGVFAIKLKRGTMWAKSGKPKDPVKVIDIYGDTVDPATIGNGTVANVQYSAYEYTYNGKKGMGTELLAIQVIDLVKYEGNGALGDEFSFAAKNEVKLDDTPIDLNSTEFD